MKKVLWLLVVLVLISGCSLFPEQTEEIDGMFFLEGGTFTMGDVWGDGAMVGFRLACSAWDINS